ncbi:MULTISPECIES: hypothetical protein [unclassified Bradyrhizobium]|uniref:hypothetical protein n=1 Tax=unclassified Bradyrhizobium TaxID=2631580 RepID=UPI0020B3F3FF|nr:MULTISPECIES: hypothetical protein [unclassified Bradyrhizobium]MCP3402100.1 hypothetical protein [Bradyrhizobium sp. CCGB20]MCP3410588.1 hypothetical protein [Bradyrhizobium sp. CCGB01]
MSFRLPPKGAAMRSTNLGQVLLVAALLVMLGLAAFGIAWAWDATNGVDDVAMDEHGWIALGLGSFFSLLIGCGLMTLMFFSSRRGYDEAADPFRNKEKE